MTLSITRRRFLGAGLGGCATFLSGARDDGPAMTATDARLNARPQDPVRAAREGLQPLGLGGERDGLLYVPSGYDPDQPAPLVVLLHGASGRAQNMTTFAPLAGDAGVVLLLPDARGRTWDVIASRGSFGPDVAFVDEALAHTFARVAVDPARLAVGGFSDGASYALGLGLANGDLFSHVVAFSPGYVPEARREGRPPVFVSHGTRDQVLPIDATSRRIVPLLTAAGYEVVYREFDGRHEVPAPVSQRAFDWFTG